MIWNFCYSTKVCPDLSEAHFSVFMSHFLDITKTGNFRSFGKLFTNKFATFFVAFWHSIFKQEKQNEVRAHEACCNGRHLHIQECSYKKTIIIKMNKMLNFQIIVFWMLTTLFFSDYFSDLLMASIDSYLASYKVPKK